MRIGIDARSLMEMHPSGIGVYAFHVIQAMVQFAPQHEYFLFTCGRQAVETEFLSTLEQHSSVQRVHLSWSNKLFHLAAKFGCAPKIDAVINAAIHDHSSIDVLFIPNWHIVPRSNQIPTVLTVHDLSHRLHAEHLSFRRKAWHWFIAPQKLVQTVSHLIAVSQQTARDITSVMGTPRERITVIHSAIPQAAQSEPLPMPALPNRYVVVLGALEPRKNLSALLDAFELYRERNAQSDLELVIAGPIGWKSSGLVRRIEREPYVQYRGYVSSGQKTTLIQQAHCLAYVSIYEGFGFPILEAFRANVPVLAAQAGAIPEVADSAAILVDPYSIEDIASGLQALDNDNQLRRQLQNRMREHVHTYQWQSVAEHTLTVLGQVIE